MPNSLSTNSRFHVDGQDGKEICRFVPPRRLFSDVAVLPRGKDRLCGILTHACHEVALLTVSFCPVPVTRRAVASEQSDIRQRLGNIAFVLLPLCNHQPPD